LRVKGPKGTLTRPQNRLVSIDVGEGGVQVSSKGDTLQARALLGTYASHVRNMLEGVTKGFSKKLLLEGVGYKWDAAGKTLNLSLGFSHPVKMAIPDGVAVAVDKSALTVSGFDKETVGQFAANIRALKKPEPYKGKGIRYDGELVRRKQGKKAA
jgi:large subunit ribosomal protein L6